MKISFRHRTSKRLALTMPLRAKRRQPASVQSRKKVRIKNSSPLQQLNVTLAPKVLLINPRMPQTRVKKAFDSLKPSHRPLKVHSTMPSTMIRKLKHSKSSVTSSNNGTASNRRSRTLQSERSRLINRSKTSTWVIQSSSISLVRRTKPIRKRLVELRKSKPKH